MEKEKKQNIAIIAMSILILILIILIILILTGVINFNKSSGIDNKMDNNIVENDVEDDEIDDNSTKEKEYLIITADSVRIRDKASTKGKILGTVNKKSKVELIDFNDGSSGNGCTDNWYKVLYKGNVGYVCGQYAVEEDEYVDADLKNANKIKNTDVKNLLNIVRRTNSYEPNYLETSLSKMDGSQLLTIAIDNVVHDSEDYLLEMTQKMKEEIISKNSFFDDTGLLYRYLNYDSNKVFDKVKTIFNVDKKDMKFDYSKLQCFNYSYIENVNVIFEMENCGGPAAYYTEVVQSYEENSDSVVVITEIESIEVDDVYDDEANGKKLKYTFKKNNSGKYYVSEIEKYS